MTRLATRLIALTLTLALTGCASMSMETTPPSTLDSEATPEHGSKARLAVTCAAKYGVTGLLVPFMVGEVIILGVMTPVTILIDKEKTLEQWKAIGLPKPECASA